jgi:hypothetical protein
LYRREILVRIGGWNTNLVCSQDRDLCTRALSVVKRAKHIQEPGFVYRLHHTDSSISSTKGRLRVQSEWMTNMLMTAHVLRDVSPQRKAALQSLARRKIRNAESALLYHDFAVARRIMFSDRTIWMLGFRDSVKGLLLLCRALRKPSKGRGPEHDG